MATGKFLLIFSLILLQVLKWRVENKIDGIIDEKFPVLEKFCPYSLEGRDKENGTCTHKY